VAAEYCGKFPLSEEPIETCHPERVKRAEGSHNIPAYLRQPHERRYWVYFLASSNQRTLYIGVTSDLAQRLREHRNPDPTSAAFSTRYHTVHLVYYEAFDGIDVAIAREKRLKGWRREKKNALVAQMNPRWEDLSARFERELPVLDEPIRGEEIT
jgi:putative endonuclease